MAWHVLCTFKAFSNSFVYTYCTSSHQRAIRFWNQW